MAITCNNFGLTSAKGESNYLKFICDCGGGSWRTAPALRKLESHNWNAQESSAIGIQFCGGLAPDLDQGWVFWMDGWTTWLPGWLAVGPHWPQEPQEKQQCNTHKVFERTRSLALEKMGEIGTKIVSSSDFRARSNEDPFSLCAPWMTSNRGSEKLIELHIWCWHAAPSPVPSARNQNFTLFNFDKCWNTRKAIASPDTNLPPFLAISTWHNLCSLFRKNFHLHYILLKDIHTSHKVANKFCAFLDFLPAAPSFGFLSKGIRLPLFLFGPKLISCWELRQARGVAS